MTHEESLQKANRHIATCDKPEPDPFRPAYHFTPPVGWMNDPNGLIHYKGLYHLFYQYNPYSASWASMHWGHAVSKDLIHWEHLPVALAPSAYYDSHENGGCFSGSAFEKDGLLYLMYTGTAFYDGRMQQAQCLAVSSDGIHFEKLTQNPVITSPGCEDFRDPKVFRHGDLWYCVIGSHLDGDGCVLLYASNDLLNWQYKSVLAKGNGKYGHMWECPDFFPLGDRHVLLLSPCGLGDRKCIWFVGDMDFETGHYSWDQEGEVDWGFDFYAPQSFLDDKGRRIIIGWQNSWSWMPWWKDFGPTQAYGWCGQMSTPRELKLSSDNRLAIKPMAELETMRKEVYTRNDLTISDSSSLFALSQSACEIEISYDLSRTRATAFGIRLNASDTSRCAITCDLKAGEWIFQRKNNDTWEEKKCPLVDRCESAAILRILVDAGSVEIFTDSYHTSLSFNVYFGQGPLRLELFTQDGTVQISHLGLYALI